MSTRKLHRNVFICVMVGVAVFLISVNTVFARVACDEHCYYLDVWGNANGFIEFVKYLCSDGTAELWYNNFSVTGDGGGTWSGVEAILPWATTSPPLKYLPPQVGQSWTSMGYSNGYEVDSEAMVLSLSETVSVTSGTFTNCAKTEETLSYPHGYTPGQVYPLKFERWFAPGMGPVKLKIYMSDGSTHTGQLTAYDNITASPDDYFPLGMDFTWQFTMSDGRSANWAVGPCSECFSKDDVKAMYQAYKNGEATLEDVVECFQEYLEHRR